MIICQQTIVDVSNDLKTSFAHRKPFFFAVCCGQATSLKKTRQIFTKFQLSVFFQKSNSPESPSSKFWLGSDNEDSSWDDQDVSEEEEASEDEVQHPGAAALPQKTSRVAFANPRHRTKKKTTTRKGLVPAKGYFAHNLVKEQKQVRAGSL